VQRVLAKAAQDSDSEDEFSRRPRPKPRADSLNETLGNEQLTFTNNNAAKTAESEQSGTEHDEEEDEDDEFGGEVYGYGKLDGTTDDATETDISRTLDRGREVLRFNNNVFQATVPLYTFKKAEDDGSDSDNDGITRRRRPTWRIVDNTNNDVDLTAEEAEEDEDVEEDEDEDEYDEDEYDEDEEIQDEDEEEEVVVETTMSDEDILNILKGREMDLLRSKLFVQPISISKDSKKKGEKTAKKERPPSRVQTSVHLLEFLSQERPVPDEEERFLSELYSILLTRFSIEKAQSAPYLNYQEPVSKATMLLLAVEKGYLDILMLMQAIHTDRIKLHLVDRDGNSPLHIACQRGDLPVVRFLVEELNHPYAAHPGNGWTPLMYATSMGHWHIVEYMLYEWDDARMRYYEKNKDKFPPIRIDEDNNPISPFANEPRPSVYEYNSRYETPLILAASNGFLNVLRIIMEYTYKFPAPFDEEGNPITKFNDGINTLVKIDEQQRKRRLNRHARMEKIKFVPVHYIDHCNVDGLSAVMCAMKYGQLLCVEYLLTQGAKDNFESVFWRPPVSKRKKNKKKNKKRSGSQSRGADDDASMSRMFTSEDGSQRGSESNRSRGDDDDLSISKSNREGSQSQNDLSQIGSDNDMSQISKMNNSNDMSHISHMSKSGISASQFSALSGTSRFSATDDIANTSYLYAILPLLEKIALSTVASKKNGVTADHVETALSRGRMQWKDHAGARRVAELLVEGDFNLPETMFSKSEMGYYLAFHVAKMDNLSSFYIKRAEDKGQLQSCVMLLELYQRLWEQIPEIPAGITTENMMRDLDLSFKLEYYRKLLHVQTTRRNALMCRQRIQEAKRHERLAQLLMQTTSAQKMVNVWDLVLKRYDVANRLDPQNQLYEFAVRYVRAGLNKCRKESKKAGKTK